MKVIDKADLPEVAEFLEKQLAPFDLSKLEWFKLLPLPKERWRYFCQLPKRVRPRSRKFARQYRLRASVGLAGPFPYSEKIPIGTRRVNTRRSWDYIYADVVFADARELAVFAAGSCAFRFLRHSRQVPGRSGHPAAHRHGLDYLDSWRARGIDRRGLIAHEKAKMDLEG